MARWKDLGPVEQFTRPVTPVAVGKVRYAVTNLGGRYGVISAVCNHAGGPLAGGRCEGEYLVCPWHGWKYHALTGKGEPGYEADAVPSHAVLVEGGRLLVDLDSATPRTRGDHPPHAWRAGRSGPPEAFASWDLHHQHGLPESPLLDLRRAARRGHGVRQEGPGGRDTHHPARRAAIPGLRGVLLEERGVPAPGPARSRRWTRTISSTRSTEAFVHWADVFLVATPIRWGAASSLYFKMVERMNCIQNQITIANRVLLRSKVAAFIITGGQDNVQAVPAR